MWCTVRLVFLEGYQGASGKYYYIVWDNVRNRQLGNYYTSLDYLMRCFHVFESEYYRADGI
jgi:hypothetical protein